MQLTNKIGTILNDFKYFKQYRTIFSVYLSQSQSILDYLGLSCTLTVYLGLSLSIYIYLCLSLFTSVYLCLTLFSRSILVGFGQSQSISVNLS